MAHEIMANDGLVLVREKAWHGLGIVIPESVTPMEALKIGGLDWTVEESIALTATFDNAGTPEREVVETHKTLRRSDDKTILSTVSVGYCVLQNQRLAEIASALGKEGQVKVETAGSLFGGRRLFFLLQGDTIDVGNTGDLVKQYALFTNAHDGTMSTTLFPTGVRVVCNNTLTMALNERTKSVYRWRHTPGLEIRIDEIKSALSAYGQAASDEADVMQVLAKKQLKRDQIQELWVDVLTQLDGEIPSNPKTAKEANRRQKAVDALSYMSKVFDTEAQMFDATAWVAANALTNYIQHRRGQLKGDARLNSDLFGTYRDAKQTAMEAALALV